MVKFAPTCLRSYRLALAVSFAVSASSAVAEDFNSATDSATESSYTFGFEHSHPAARSLPANQFSRVSGVRVVNSSKRSVYSELNDYRLHVQPLGQKSPAVEPSAKMLAHPQVWDLHVKLDELRATSTPDPAATTVVQHQQVFHGTAPEQSVLTKTLVQAADYSEQAVNVATDLAIDAWRTFLAPNLAYADDSDPSAVVEETVPDSPFPLHSFERDALVHF